MRWQPLSDRETDALLEENRPVAAAFAIAGCFADGGEQITRKAEIRILVCAALLLLLPLLHGALGGWAWAIGAAGLLLILDGILAWRTGGDLRRTGRVAAQGLGATIERLRAAGRALPDAALLGEDDLVLRIRGGAGEVGIRGSAHARLETAAALDADGLPPAWSAWAAQAGDATILRLDGRLLVLGPDGVPRAFRPSPKDLAA